MKYALITSQVLSTSLLLLCTVTSKSSNNDTSSVFNDQCQMKCFHFCLRDQTKHKKRKDLQRGEPELTNPITFDKSGWEFGHSFILKVSEWPKLTWQLQFSCSFIFHWALQILSNFPGLFCHRVSAELPWIRKGLLWQHKPPDCPGRRCQVIFVAAIDAT